MKNIVDCKPGVCSWAMTASFMANMQHTDEQYGFPMLLSLEPTHWMKATFFGISPSEGRSTRPLKGPVAESMRSISRLEITLGNLPYPYSLRLVAILNSSKPGERIMEPTDIDMCWSSCEYRMASASHCVSHRPQPMQIS